MIYTWKHWIIKNKKVGHGPASMHLWTPLETKKRKIEHRSKPIECRNCIVVFIFDSGSGETMSCLSQGKLCVNLWYRFFREGEHESELALNNQYLFLQRKYYLRTVGRAGERDLLVCVGVLGARKVVLGVWKRFCHDAETTHADYTKFHTRQDQGYGASREKYDRYVLFVQPIMSTLDWNAYQFSDFNSSTASIFAPKTLKIGCFTVIWPLENESRLVPIMTT